MGHLNFKYLQQLHNEKIVEGLPLIKSYEGMCIGFLLEKNPERKYGVGKERRYTSTLDLIHNDVSGPMPTTSINGSIYFLTFIDDYSRYCWVYFLKQKSEVLETFKVFITLAENTLEKKIKVLRSDNGGM